eukprot:2533392-Rhodomonas_salina.1
MQGALPPAPLPHVQLTDLRERARESEGERERERGRERGVSGMHCGSSRAPLPHDQLAGLLRRRERGEEGKGRETQRGTQRLGVEIIGVCTRIWTHRGEGSLRNMQRGARD